MYLNGIEKANGSVATIIQYANPNLVLSGVGQSVNELIFYNYDMMTSDFERSAQDELATLKYKLFNPCLTAEQFYNPETATC